MYNLASRHCVIPDLLPYLATLSASLSLSSLLSSSSLSPSLLLEPSLSLDLDLWWLFAMLLFSFQRKLCSACFIISMVAQYLSNLTRYDPSFRAYEWNMGTEINRWAVDTKWNTYCKKYTKHLCGGLLLKVMVLSMLACEMRSRTVAWNKRRMNIKLKDLIKE